MDVVDQAWRDVCRVSGWPAGWDTEFVEVPVAGVGDLVGWLSAPGWRAAAGNGAVCALVRLAQQGEQVAMVALLAVFGPALRRVAARVDGADLAMVVGELTELVYRVRVAPDTAMAVGLVTWTRDGVLYRLRAGRPAPALVAWLPCGAPGHDAVPAAGRTSVGWTDDVADRLADRLELRAVLRSLSHDDVALVVQTRVLGVPLEHAVAAGGRTRAAGYKRRARAEIALRRALTAA